MSGRVRAGEGPHPMARSEGRSGPGVPYDFAEVERRWQARWDADRLYEVDLDSGTTEDVFYNLVEFPYPSAEGLHVGHVFKYGGADVLGRYRRMCGRSRVPAHGVRRLRDQRRELRAEDRRAPGDRSSPAPPPTSGASCRRSASRGTGAAASTRRSPSTTAGRNGSSRACCFRAGLAYRADAPVTWCPSCATVLAKELVEDGRCERCDSTVTERVLCQWFLRTTAYAERLVRGLDDLDWPESAKRKQRNWIHERRRFAAAPRLAGLAAALLGHSPSRSCIARRAGRFPCPTRICRSSCRQGSTAARAAMGATRWLARPTSGCTRRARRAAGQARATPRCSTTSSSRPGTSCGIPRPTSPTARGTRRARRESCRWTSTPAGPSTSPATTCSRGS